MTLPTKAIPSNNNRYFLLIDGYDFSKWVVSANLNAGGDLIEAPHGNRDSQYRMKGLSSNTFSVTLRYDERVWGLLANVLSFGNKVMIAYGPDGNAPGCPLHFQEFISPGFGGERGAEKPSIVIDVEMQSTEDAIYDATSNPPSSF